MKIFFKLLATIRKNFTLKNILVGLLVVLVVSISKQLFFGGLTAPFSFENSLILGTIGLITRLASTGLVEYLIDNLNLLDHTKMSVTGTPITSYHMLPARGGEANISGNVASSSANNPGDNVASSSANNPGDNVASSSANNPNNVPDGANPTGADNQFVDWGDTTQLAGNKTNGPLHINDPLDQSRNGYNTNATNQPFARNLAAGLDHQNRLIKGTISKYTLTENDKAFLIAHLKHHEQYYYDRAMYSPSRTGDPQWWKLGNSKKMRDSLRNTP